MYRSSDPEQLEVRWQQGAQTRGSAGEFEAVRRSTIDLIRHLDTAAWTRGGTANNNPVTVRALAYLIGGHTEHHLEILKSRYLPN